MNTSSDTLRAVVFGATGMVGEGVLHECLHHHRVESVLVIGRRSCGVRHPKVKEVVHVDFFNLAPLEERLKGYNACFFCLGVTSVGKKEQVYNRTTYDLTMNVASTLSQLNPAMTFCYVSGAGTDSTERGRIMWARVKGRTENHLTLLPFKKVYNFRPGFIKPTKGLRNAYALASAFGLFHPLWMILFPRYVCTLEDLGLAMINVSLKGYPKQILENVDIAKSARSTSMA
jgi:uncharacterized protein YbjT (DUF2867 family)